MIELEREAKHRRMRDKTFPSVSPLCEWLADMHGTGAERGAKIISLDERRAARGERSKRQGTIRVRRSLAKADHAIAVETIAVFKVRREYLREGRAVWEAEVWLELLNPSKLVAGRERKRDIRTKVRKAINRAQDKMHRQLADRTRYLPLPEMRRN